MNITLANKQVEIRLSNQAKRALAQRETPLLAEMELRFACMVRKHVYFRAQGQENATQVTTRLAVSFRPVITRACTVAGVESSQLMAEVLIDNPTPYVPHWLAIDYRKGQWLGEFGY